MSEELICPRCANTTFTEIWCGADSYDNDITWTSYVCTQCELWYSGWSEKWLIDCEYCQDEDEAEEYRPDTEEKVNELSG